MCVQAFEQFVEKFEEIPPPFVYLLLAPTCFTTGFVDAVIKVGATTASIFERVIPEEINQKINGYARIGLGMLKENGAWSFKLLPQIAFTALCSLIPGFNDRDIGTSLGNQLQDSLFKKVLSLRNQKDSDTFTKEALARFAFFGATLVILIAKVGQLALGLLAGALSLASLNGLFGYFDLRELHTFAENNLHADLLETLCDGLRYTFHPDRALKEGYASRYERIG